MILVGNQRGGAKNLAAHLMKSENERVDVHQIRGFIGRDLQSALMESYAISRGTQCRQHMFSLSLNPPKDAYVSADNFEAAIDKAEEQLGLSGQPRAIVFHEKYGDDGKLRRHAHAVWCRIKVEEMKAVQLSFTRQKLQELARDLYIEHGWQMPRGFVDRAGRDPMNFTLEEWQQAKRAGKDPRKIKGIFKDAWATSDSKASFAAALKEHGYILAQGDRRGYVAVDYQGEKYAISRYVGIKTKQVHARLGDVKDLPSTDQAHAETAGIVTTRLKVLKAEQSQLHRQTQSRLKAEKQRTREKQEAERQRLAKEQEKRTQAENTTRQARIRKGLPGLWDRFTGQRRKTLLQNEFEAAQSKQRDECERQAVNTKQAQTRQRMQEKADTARNQHANVQRELSDDVQTINAKAEAEKNRQKDAFIRKRKSAADLETAMDHPSSANARSCPQMPDFRSHPSPDAGVLR